MPVTRQSSAALRGSAGDAAGYAGRTPFSHGPAKEPASVSGALRSGTSAMKEQAVFALLGEGAGRRGHGGGVK